MKYAKEEKSGSPKLLIGIIVVLALAVAVLTALLLWPDGAPQQQGQMAQTGQTEPGKTQEQPQLPQEQTQTLTGQTEEPEQTEEPGVPVILESIVLAVPADVKEQITTRQTALKDGQLVQFFTTLEDEELELFRVSINQSGAEGHRLGILKDDAAGELVVTIHVQEHPSGDWTPEQYALLNSLQERVNDIISQFYEDPRFVPGA